MIGTVILVLYVVTLVPAFRIVFRALAGSVSSVDRVDIAFISIVAGLCALMGAPLIVAYHLVTRGVKDPAVLVRKIGGEDKEDKRARLKREIEQLDRELDLD